MTQTAWMTIFWSTHPLCFKPHAAFLTASFTTNQTIKVSLVVVTHFVFESWVQHLVFICLFLCCRSWWFCTAFFLLLWSLLARHQRVSLLTSSMNYIISHCRDTTTHCCWASTTFGASSGFVKFWSIVSSLIKPVVLHQPFVFLL